ncbi:hypothetical protein PG990_002068 [Apiospora arundinis]|jgi:type II secretory pathway pseudopilin PulG|uniref:Uncharacterized protein n=1 Tax=Apiospora arundinis TaxID=335852 RepID=A0ABR2I3N6_9PEZI
MQYATALLGLLAATGALALPAVEAEAAQQVTVTLRGANELATQTQLDKNGAKKPTANGSPFTSVELASHNIKNDKGQDLRCKIFDARGRAITITRGANVDTTFSDAGKGPWKFKSTKVSKIQCSTKFNAKAKRSVDEFEVVEARDEEEVAEVAVDDVEDEAEDEVEARAVDANGPLTVTLAGPSELATQTRLGEKDAKAPTGSKGPYNTVTLKVGSGNKNARCQLTDANNKIVTLVRGKNVDVTFGDGGKGAWKFQDGKARNIKQIKCDPSFKSRN